MTSSLNTKGVGLTDVGQLRSSNQDSYLVEEKERLYIVADGMGGHAGGEIASQLCIEQIHSYINENLGENQKETTFSHPDLKVLSVLANAVNHSSTKIYERALEEPFLKGMGTTATVIKFIGNFAYVAHVGDSRLYLLRSNFIYQITHDHSLVSEQVRAGILTKEEAELHHLKNVITRSVGYQEEEDVDTQSLALEQGDLFILCSDGLHGKINDKELANIVSDNRLKSPKILVDLANERGGEDNITVIVIEAIPA